MGGYLSFSVPLRISSCLQSLTIPVKISPHRVRRHLTVVVHLFLRLSASDHSGTIRGFELAPKKGGVDPSRAKLGFLATECKYVYTCTLGSSRDQAALRRIENHSTHTASLRKTDPGAHRTQLAIERNPRVLWRKPEESTIII